MVKELPYFAGKEIPQKYLGEYFFNREKELKELKWKLERTPPLNFALYGQRRVGKTSLIEKLKQELEKKNLPIFIKCEELLPLDELTFLENLTLRLLEEYSKLSPLLGVKKTMQDLVITTKIGLEMADLAFWLRFGEKKITLKEALDKSFDLINKISLKSKKKVIIFLDEFQELFAFGDKFLWALRAKIASSQASFVVSSSWHRFKEELTHEKRPFFNFFETYEIKAVPKEEARDFLLRRARKFNLCFDEAVLDKILEVSECKPFYLQLLALKCYILSLPRKKVTLRIFEAALKETIASIPAHLVTGFERLRGRNKEVFLVLCLFDFKKPAEIASKIGLDAKNVIVILARLIKEHDLVKKERNNYFTADKFLKEYVKLQYIDNSGN
ncbi:ATP-binding protein [Candidatus Woesearchaeota archaeon]|nr:ATP-binding protein [Candidatus Woesearchaeota archaeon]